MLLTFKTQLNLSDEQQTIVDAMSNDGRMLYNHFLGKLKEQYEKDKTFISYYKQQKELKDYKCEYLTFDVKKEILIIENILALEKNISGAMNYCSQTLKPFMVKALN